jgi:Domain of unknown function (DUF4116)
MKSDIRVLEGISQELRENDEFMLTAIKRNAQAITYASSELLNDHDFLRRAIKQNIKGLLHCNNFHFANFPQHEIKFIFDCIREEVMNEMYVQRKTQ